MTRSWSEIPWLNENGGAGPSRAQAASPPAQTPARRLLREHLDHGSSARREPAAFALVLTLPEAAAAVRGFLAGKRPS